MGSHVARRSILWRNRMSMLDRRPVPVVVTGTTAWAYDHVVASGMNIKLVALLRPV